MGIELELEQRNRGFVFRTLSATEMAYLRVRARLGLGSCNILTRTRLLCQKERG